MSEPILEKNQLTIYVWLCFGYIIHMPILYSLDYCILIVSFKVKLWRSSNLIIFDNLGTSIYP